MIVQNLAGYSGIKVGARDLNNLRFAGDTALIVENKEKLKQLSDTVEGGNRMDGMELKSKKREVMLVSRSNECPPIIKISLSGINLIKRTNSNTWVPVL